MSSTAVFEGRPSNGDATLPADAHWRRIRFVKEAPPGCEVLLRLPDPSPHSAVCVNTELPSAAGIDIVTVPRLPSDHLGGAEDLVKWVGEASGSPPTTITLHGAQIVWSPGRAAIVAAPDRLESFFLALLEFSYYEAELTRIECEVRESWPRLESDTLLAHRVADWDPQRFQSIGNFTEETLKRRIRWGRIHPRLLQPLAHQIPLANQLVDRLREKTHVEVRVEGVAAQLDVFERILESSSQRISDFTFARKESTLAWVIIVVLVTESLLIFLQLLHTSGV